MEPYKKKRKKCPTKNCAYCGKFFRADQRVGGRQKSCFRVECKKRRKNVSQQRWLQANPDYYRGRYEELKCWRAKNPGYQRNWRARRREIQDKYLPKSSIKTIRLELPVKLLQDEIQDEICLNLPVFLGSYIHTVRGREIKDKSAFLGSAELSLTP